jgi:hypothetical protein
MTGNIVDFGGKRTPSLADAGEALNAARAALPEHDPFQPVLDGLQTLVGTMERAAARIDAGPVERPLTREQMALLIRSTSLAAERGVSRYAGRISGWWSVVMGSLAGGGLLVGIAVMRSIDICAEGARMEAARVAVPAVFGMLSLADANEWAALIRANPPPHVAIAAGQALPEVNGQKAAMVPLWLDLPKPVAPHR